MEQSLYRPPVLPDGWSLIDGFADRVIAALRSRRRLLGASGQLRVVIKGVQVHARTVCAWVPGVRMRPCFLPIETIALRQASGPPRVKLFNRYESPRTASSGAELSHVVLPRLTGENVPENNPLLGIERKWNEDGQWLGDRDEVPDGMDFPPDPLAHCLIVSEDTYDHKLVAKTFHQLISQEVRGGWDRYTASRYAKLSYPEFVAFCSKFNGSWNKDEPSMLESLAYRLMLEEHAAWSRRKIFHEFVGGMILALEEMLSPKEVAHLKNVHFKKAKASKKRKK